jgi:hypothetical protein
VLSKSAIGVITLPFDFDIFLRSGRGSSRRSHVAPGDLALVHPGLHDRVEAQVRMISCACGRMSNGKCSGGASSSGQ